MIITHPPSLLSMFVCQPCTASCRISHTLLDPHTYTITHHAPDDVDLSRHLDLGKHNSANGNTDADDTTELLLVRISSWNRWVGWEICLACSPQTLTTNLHLLIYSDPSSCGQGILKCTQILVEWLTLLG